MNSAHNHRYSSVIIVGAGPAGIGLGALFKQLGLDNFIILDRHDVGSTFKKWPKEMKLLTPSFPGHGFGLLDLNAVVPSTSPGYAYASEHLTGNQYADYLKRIASHFRLPLEKGVEVNKIDKEKKGFTLHTNQKTYSSDFVVWAGGEFQYPDLSSFTGSENCQHTSHVHTWSSYRQSHYYIIGGYESGMDAAFHLTKQGNQVTVLSKGAPWQDDDPDPSVSLSPFTSQRLNDLDPDSKTRLKLKDNAEVFKVEIADSGYLIHLSSGDTLFSETKPFIATGFKSSLTRVFEHFFWEENGDIRLTDKDESTVSQGLFLSGPQVKHEDVIFCFIYKFRQRFAVIAQEICTRLGIEPRESVLELYRQSNMYLEDLTCCDNSCEC
ncbi:NAD(P)-binding domain-containing protein [Salipaludibacillus sp. CUR1]|uniref:NAD(P)/FAD-dependent oxidoreductase n=1 Tax=Salipaludibacillus sp. CUR1 TaxID=2820003 RepID=UPI001E2FCF93|nr:NAD(P)/FAD-dependent oxidoreductase [Salipaludibacillus sp. CUR1]MCE7793094.1 NAD(P)-binding domain-containing protein [Salipaludibacillus sp. CUR1]